jgi:hypothetical protein
MSSLAGIKTPYCKWKVIFELFAIQFGAVWRDRVPQIDNYHIKVRSALRALKQYAVRRWIISLDDFHIIFNQLDDAEMETMAEQMKLVLLDNESPCYFALAGSTQATFWWSLHKARPNGLNMMVGATTLTTPFASSDREIRLCKEVLIRKENAVEANLNEALDLLALHTTANLSQVLLLLFSTNS